MAKFKVDENLPGQCAVVLRDAGHDVATVWDEDLAGHPDEDIAAAVRSEGRTLVTLDLGFADIRAYRPEDYAGLVVLRLERQDSGHVLGVLKRLLPVLAEEDPAGHLWIVEESQIRVRP